MEVFMMVIQYHYDTKSKGFRKKKDIYPIIKYAISTVEINPFNFIYNLIITVPVAYQLL